jgi:hypothetical protein
LTTPFLEVSSILCGTTRLGRSKSWQASVIAGPAQ